MAERDLNPEHYRTCPRCGLRKSPRAKLCRSCSCTIQRKRRLARAGHPLHKLAPL